MLLDSTTFKQYSKSRTVGTSYGVACDTHHILSLHLFLTFSFDYLSTTTTSPCAMLRARDTTLKTKILHIYMHC